MGRPKLKRLTCNTCGKTKPREAFPLQRKNKEYRRGRCKSCTKKWLQSPEGKAHRKKVRLKRRYGITPRQYVKLHQAQKGRCLICGKKRKLCVDHDHETGEVRGLLCLSCNSGLGYFHDNLRLVRRAVIYLRRYA